MSTVLKSFVELAEVLDVGELPEKTEPAEITSLDAPPETPGPAPDLQALLTELQTASATLAAIARRDQEARTVALRDLERYDAIVARQREAEQAHERARQMHIEAERLAEGAFAEEARAEARHLIALATRVEETMAQVAEQRRQEAVTLASQLDLDRLLAERRQQQEAEQAKAAEAERARRLAGALARARAALAAGRLEEAKELLGPVASENPDNPEIGSFRTIMAQRELVVKVDAAEDALWEARRAYRRDPETAVAQLETLEIDGLPEPLGRQVFGEWARACARLCRERDLAEPLRYAPDPGRGAILVREQANDTYVVVSALGMGPEWRKGSVVSERQIRRARPLR